MQSYSTPSEAYLATLADVYYYPSFVTSPRGEMTYERENYRFAVRHPSALPIITRDAERNAVIAEYTRKEFELYASGERRASEFTKLSTFWAKLADKDGNIESAYGWKVWFERSVPDGRTQWEWCKDELKKDPSTRRAVLLFCIPSTQRDDNLDVTCTMHGMFTIREGLLHFHIVMRSNDVVRGLVYDMPWFMSLQIKMAEELGIHYGCYTHFAHSMHVYLSQIERIRRMLG